MNRPTLNPGNLNLTDLNVFVESVAHYFHQISAESAQVRPSYLSDSGNIGARDYTGLIRISGQYQGNVYFTAPSAMLRHLLVSQGETQHSEEHLLDLVGEVANTLSGNARRHFGERFVISVPQALRGAPDSMTASSRPFVIPLSWKKYNALLIVDVSSRAS